MWIIGLITGLSQRRLAFAPCVEAKIILTQNFFFLFSASLTHPATVRGNRNRNGCMLNQSQCDLLQLMCCGPTITPRPYGTLG